MTTIKITDNPKVKTSALMQQMRDRFKVWSCYTDEQLDKDFPAPKKTTVRYFKDTVEADEDLANKSADDLKKEGIEGITLRERLIMEIQHWDEAKTNLDIENITLCSGSRYADGDVPYVDRSVGGDVNVNRYGPQGRDPDVRARRAVNLSSLNLVPSVIDSTTQNLIIGKLDAVEEILLEIKKQLK